MGISKNEPSDDDQLANLKKEVSELIADIQEYSHQRLKNIAGPRLSEMLQSIENTVMYLQHPMPKARQAAIILLNRHWGLTSQLILSVEEIVFKDTDRGVRAEALGALGRYYSGTKDARIGFTLASIVRDRNEPMEIRFIAYLSLISLHGEKPYAYLPQEPEKITCSEDIVNWELVNQYCREQG